MLNKISFSLFAPYFVFKLDKYWQYIGKNEW